MRKRGQRRLGTEVRYLEGSISVYELATEVLYMIAFSSVRILPIAQDRVCHMKCVMPYHNLNSGGKNWLRNG